MENPLGTEDPLDIAVFECVIAHGIDAVTMEMVAKRAGVSRASLFRQYACRNDVLRRAHRRAARLIGWWVPRSGGDRRFELEWWWSTMMQFFATDWGRAFLALRAHAGNLHGVERSELGLMPDLVKWAGVSMPVLRSIWSLVITAACPSFDEDERATVRELVYAMLVGGLLRGDDSDELSEIVALEAPL
jgi:AcrR family transcriptional regulator